MLRGGVLDRCRVQLQDLEERSDTEIGSLVKLGRCKVCGVTLSKGADVVTMTVSMAMLIWVASGVMLSARSDVT